uniref:Uncharacterized protein n=1 Tax=Globodera pallida TaxID=36090 RepID=A0A183CR80_GLOPA
MLTRVGVEGSDGGERSGDFVLKDGQSLSEDMKDLFSDIKSRFVRQFECFQLCCAPAQSVLDFGATVNAKCERADMSLSKEEIKCMIFISGLGDSHRDLRHECLRQMEKGRSATPPRTIKLETLLEECRAIQSLQSSSAALGNPGQVHAIQSRPQKALDIELMPYYSNELDDCFQHCRGFE